LKKARSLPHCHIKTNGCLRKSKTLEALQNAPWFHQTHDVSGRNTTFIGESKKEIDPDMASENLRPFDRRDPASSTAFPQTPRAFWVGSMDPLFFAASSAEHQARTL
jgi:hypothetical protein